MFIMRQFNKLLFFIFGILSIGNSLNINFGRDNILEIFGYNSNDVNDIVDEDHNDPPPHDQVARMARFITHESNWAAMATISSRSPTTGSPFANIFSVSDGPVEAGSGVPYIYISPWEISAQDLRHNNNVSLTMTLAQVADTNYINKATRPPLLWF